MITGIIFKGLDALKIENDKLSVIVIPELGGKIASVIKKNKNFEYYFQHKKEIFLKPKLNSNFAEFDASGFDDCFPTVDSCSVGINGKMLNYPDHGEVWSKVMTYEIAGNILKLSCISEILSYTYEKCITLEDETLLLNYKINNTGSESFPCIWTMHGLLNCEEDMEIFLPPGTESVANVQPGEIFGEPGKVYSYPLAVLKDGNIYHLNKIKPEDSHKTEKFYVNGDITIGECGVYYPSKDLNCKICFNPEELPYLGLWITEGGFRGDYNLALEPSNGFYDSIDIAAKNNKLKRLNSGDLLEFNCKIKFSDGKYK